MKNVRVFLAAIMALFLCAPVFADEKFKDTLKKAEQGDAEAQFSLGGMYSGGRGVPEDDVEAVKWYRKAAEQGEVLAQFQLGFMYYSGEGVPEDDAKAYMFWNLAAAKGHEKGEENREIIKKRMTREQIAEGQKLTREWLERKAKEKGE